MKHDLVRIVSCAALLLSPSCRSSEAAMRTSSASIPRDEAWLTAEEANAAHIEVARAEERAIDDEVITSGQLAADDRRIGHLFSPVTGRVVAITAHLGEHVAKGAPLAVIESPDLGAARGDAAKTEADLIAAGHDYARQKDLNEHGAASAVVLERSRDAWRRAGAEAERAKAKASLLSKGQVDAVSQTFTLVAPVDGEVLARNVSSGLEVQGQYVGGTAVELFTVGALDRIWVLGDVYESDLARMHVGAPADITVTAYEGRVFHSTVDWMSSTLDPATRTAKIRCVLDNADRALSPNMYAIVRVKVDAVRALAIPRSAVARFGDYRTVFIRAGDAEGERGRYVRTPVHVDESGGDWLVVQHGVSVGQDVVVRGVPELLRRL